jgi:hypothetical protein
LTTAWKLSKEDRTLVRYATDVLGWRRWSHLLENDPESDFKMVYYSDGSQSTMCGNGDVWWLSPKN